MAESGGDSPEPPRAWPVNWGRRASCRKQRLLAMRPPLLPITDTTKRDRRLLKRPGRTESSHLAPAAPVVLLPGKPAYVTLSASVTGLTCNNTVRLPPPGPLADFRQAKRGFAHHPGTVAQVVQVLLYPQQVRVWQLVRGRDGQR